MAFKLLDSQDFIISAEKKVSKAFPIIPDALTTFHVKSSQTTSTSGDYFYDVYADDPSNDSDALPVFSEAYGKDTTTTDPGEVIYKQMRMLLIGKDENFFNNSSEEIFAISIYRNSFLEKLVPSTFELKIKGTPNNLILVVKPDTLERTSEGQRVYDIVDNTNNTEVYGKMYPDVGIIILDHTKIVNSTDVTSNDTRLTTANGSNISSFKLQKEETITSNFVFVRARNNEFNYTTNPSFVGSDGNIIKEELIGSPETYITTVGLYNDNQDLLAVAKLSRPLLKNSTKEALIRIKLDY